jgi:hypothetical protein
VARENPTLIGSPESNVHFELCVHRVHVHSCDKLMTSGSLWGNSKPVSLTPLFAADTCTNSLSMERARQPVTDDCSERGKRQVKEVQGLNAGRKVCSLYTVASLSALHRELCTGRISCHQLYNCFCPVSSLRFGRDGEDWGR